MRRSLREFRGNGKDTAKAQSTPSFATSLVAELGVLCVLAVVFVLSRRKNDRAAVTV